MTEQEAIEELKCYRACSGTQLPEEMEIAIKALEKQIAKKVTEFNNPYHLDFVCPSCNTATYGQPYEPNYCKHCGQKLDWGNEDAE